MAECQTATQTTAPPRVAEQRTRWVLWITLLMMVLEVTVGYLSHSMALLADGWHMASHALAIGMTVLTYALARRYATDTRFTWGTWKVEVLGSFASALLLLAVAVSMIWQSVERLLQPEPIAYGEAMVVAVVGLVVNAVCALLLGGAHDHDHDHAGHAHGYLHHADDSHDHAHEHDEVIKHDHQAAHELPKHRDLNLYAAYVHVLADALTSVLAIAALAAGWLWGWQWLDAAIGILGAVLVLRWAKGLLAQTAKVLLDCEMDAPVVSAIRERLQSRFGDALQVRDLHVWRVGQTNYACVLGVAGLSIAPQQVRDALADLHGLYHVTVEVAPTIIAEVG